MTKLITRFKARQAQGLAWLLITLLGMLLFNQLASSVFLVTQAISLHHARPWTWVVYLHHYINQPKVVLAILASLIMPLSLTILTLLVFVPGDTQATRRRHVRYGLLSVLVLFAYGELWGLLVQLFYPAPAPIYPWHAVSLAMAHTTNSYKLNLVLGITFLAPIGFATVILYRHYQEQEFAKLFGDAHWATWREIKKMGLFEAGDVVIGYFKGKLLMTKLVSHLLIFAPSRSGKGVSQVIPNALCFRGSLLVIDLKQEVYEYTSGFRQQHGQHIYLFAPGNSKHKTHCWNPLDFVSNDPGQLISDLQTIIEIVIQKTGKESDPMWINEARALALGLLLWLKESGRPFTLGELNNLVKGTPDFTAYLQSILDSAVIADNLINIAPAAYINLNNFVQKAEKERSGVKSNLTASLTLWDDPYVVSATSSSDFDVRDMRKKPMTIYLGIPPNQLERLAPLMNLFVQQFLGLLTEELPDKTIEPYKVLAILDEFCNLGRMHKLRKGFSYLAGYHVHLMPIIQNVAEFYDLYGKDASDTFFQNTDYKIMYRQNAMTDKEFVSKSLGDRTAKMKTHSRHVNSRSTGSLTTGEQRIRRPLLSPDEVGYFNKDHAIIQLGGESPITFKRIIYYTDKRFTSRLLPPVTIPVIEPLYPTIHVKKPDSPPENSAKNFRPKKITKPRKETLENIDDTELHDLLHIHRQLY